MSKDAPASRSLAVGNIRVANSLGRDKRSNDQSGEGSSPNRSMGDKP